MSETGLGTIQLRDVHKAYQLGSRSVVALRGVDLHIDAPGAYAIMGPSGSGKSTLLHLMAALDRPDQGTIEIAGEQVDRLSESALTRFRRHRIGIVFQQFNLISTLTALENVTLPAVLDGMPRAERERRGRDLLDALGMSDRCDHRPDALSGGEQQRVAIARALLYEPPVLMADEPTGSLDSATGEQLWALLREITQHRQLTLVLVTHEPAAAVHCDHVLLLRDGRIDGGFDVDGIDAVELATRAQRTSG